MIPVTICRFYCPLENLENIPGGSFRVGGCRLCSQTKEAGFQMIISSDTRLLIGINIEDLYDQPYIATWLHEFRDSYISELGVLDTQKKLNLARYFFADALTIRLNAHDTALTIKPSSFSPQPSNYQQTFSEGSLSCNLFFGLLTTTCSSVQFDFIEHR